MGCFGDINVSDGSVATYARCGGTFNILLTANLPGNHPVNFLNRLRFDRIMVMSLWPPFWPTMYIHRRKLLLGPGAQAPPHFYEHGARLYDEPPTFVT